MNGTLLESSESGLLGDRCLRLSSSGAASIRILHLKMRDPRRRILL
jgi:hypothetical protein